MEVKVPQRFEGSMMSVAWGVELKIVEHGCTVGHECIVEHEYVKLSPVQP